MGDVYSQLTIADDEIISAAQILAGRNLSWNENNSSIREAHGCSGILPDIADRLDDQELRGPQQVCHGNARTAHKASPQISDRNFSGHRIG